MRLVAQISVTCEEAPMHRYLIRQMRPDDIPRLVDLRPGFVSNTILKVEQTGSGLTLGWRLSEVKLATPYNKGSLYDFDVFERTDIARRMVQSNTLLEVAAERESERIVGVLDVEEEDWRHVAWVHNLMLDTDARGQGLGRQFVERTIAWARRRNLRAVMLETQTNNVPACRFYLHLGFQLVGINTAFYTNHDLTRDEVALFWSYPLKP
jgi:GNAT superfamily N-acetyltransferase